MIRPATLADAPAIAELQGRYDIAWFGAPENDEAEIAENLSVIDDLTAHSRLVWDGDRLVAAALRYRTDASITVDPDIDAGPVYGDLLDWLATVDVVQVDVLDRDAGLRDAVEGRGWVYLRSAFDMRRAYADGWEPIGPRWAEGVTVRDYGADDAATVHDLVYNQAHFAEVPGHFPRDLAEWQQLFIDGRPADEAPVIACRDERPVGVAIGRTFSDGTGWITQLAVAETERGTGIGTALMATYFARRRAAGAVAAGLGVMAANRAALRLYLAYGLQIEREYRFYGPPGTPAPN